MKRHHLGQGSSPSTNYTVDSSIGTTSKRVSIATTRDGNDSSSHSLALMQMLGGSLSAVDHFFKEYWQLKPTLTRCTTHDSIKSSYSEALPRVLSMTWDDLATLLERSRSLFLPDVSSQDISLDPPLIFRNQTAIQRDEVQTLYQNNPFAAYLDGCSIVINHSDKISVPLGSLCLDLQRTLPHVYINTYLTPPQSSAVPAHADDRDVFVVQLLGSKEWKVYEEVPILYPYAEEQVGKNADLPVPPKVLSSPMILHTTLHPGDVLYMPRGYVHQAYTNNFEPSFHATIAVATYDWTLSRSISSIIQRTLDSIPEYRMAMPLWIFDKHIPVVPDSMIPKDENTGIKREGEILSNRAENFQHQLDTALGIACRRVTLQIIAQDLRSRIKIHNDHAEAIRAQFSMSYTNSLHRHSTETNHPNDQYYKCTHPCVGLLAARNLTWKDSIRAATLEERLSVRLPQDSSDRGLTVREETGETLLSIVQYLKSKESELVTIPHLKTLEGFDKNPWICDFTLFCFVRCCVELGALALVYDA